MTPHEHVLQIAEQYLGIEEQGHNRGQLIDYWNREMGVPLGSPWCASFLMFCINGTDNQLSIKNKLFMSAHVLSIFNNSKGCWVSKPQKGFLICWQLGETSSGHIELIKDILPDGNLLCIGGNTSIIKSINREGRFVAENIRNPRAVGNLKFKGYLDPWQNVSITYYGDTKK